MPEPGNESRNLMEIKKGDMFLLDKHKIICGDATSLIDIQSLMGEKKAEMMSTDPPYNVDYSSQWRADYRAKRGDKQLKVHEKIMHDTDFNYEKWFKIIETGIIKGAIYICNIYTNFSLIYGWMTKYFKKNPHIIIWVKNNHTLSRTDYHHLYEIIFYSRSSNGIWNGGRDQKDIWRVKNRYVGSYVHPTQKPLRLVFRAILNNSNPGDIVLDPFLGSGSTLISAEQNQRICYGMELDPKYMHIIIDRWQQLTGKKAVRLA